MHLLDNDTTKDQLHRASPAEGSPAPQILVNGHSHAPTMDRTMDHLDALEAQSIYIFREAFARLKKLALLWSLGKDSNVLIWLRARRFSAACRSPLCTSTPARNFPRCTRFATATARNGSLI